MKKIFINLKRFDVDTGRGGICPMSNPKQWIEWVMDESRKNSIGNIKDMEIIYLLPESLILPAIDQLNTYPAPDVMNLYIGSQGVYKDDIEEGKNFGAFTTNLPAAAVANMGCRWSIIGHSEERRDKEDIMNAFMPLEVEGLAAKVGEAVNRIINSEVKCALRRDINVLLCIGESAEEKGEGSFEEQKDRIKKVIKKQLEICLKDVKGIIKENEMVIGYEPIWAIGPGKTPPEEAYISFVSSYIKEISKTILGYELPVVYGGGLKEENAAMIAGIDSIDGGLVALTKFTAPIAFQPQGLKNIIYRYV